MAKTNINIRVDSELKAKAQAFFESCGLDMSTAINLFLRQAIEQQRISFDIGAPGSKIQETAPVYQTARMPGFPGMPLPGGVYPAEETMVRKTVVQKPVASKAAEEPRRRPERVVFNHSPSGPEYEQLLAEAMQQFKDPENAKFAAVMWWNRFHNFEEWKPPTEEEYRRMLDETFGSIDDPTFVEPEELPFETNREEIE